MALPSGKVETAKMAEESSREVLAGVIQAEKITTVDIKCSATMHKTAYPFNIPKQIKLQKACGREPVFNDPVPCKPAEETTVSTTPELIFRPATTEEAARLAKVRGMVGGPPSSVEKAYFGGGIATYSDLKRMAQQSGFELEEGARHIIVKKGGKFVTTIPRGTNTNPHTSKGILRALFYAE